MTLDDVDVVLAAVLTPKALAAKAVTIGVKQAGQVLLTLTERTTNNFIALRDEEFRTWVAELAALMRDVVARLDAQEQAEAARRLNDDRQAGRTFANLIDDAYVEPDPERQRMLEHAAACIFNIALSVAEFTRLWRVIQEIEPDDVVMLYKLSMVPSRSMLPRGDPQINGYSDDAFRFRVWKASGADALLSTGCVRDYTETGIGMSKSMLAIQPTGRLILKAMRSYLIARRPIDLSAIPCHRATYAFCTDEDAEQMIAAFPGLRNAVLAGARIPKRGAIYYSAPNIPGGAPANGKATLRVWLRPKDVAAVIGHARGVKAEEGDPVDLLWATRQVWNPEPDYSEEENGVNVYIYGPHDVLRFLAYEVDAHWG